MIKYICFITQKLKVVIARAEVKPIYKTWRVLSRRASPGSPFVPYSVSEVFDTYEEAEKFAAIQFQDVKERALKIIEENLRRLHKRRDNLTASSIKIRKMYLVKE